LFITCLNDTLFPQTGRAVVTLLERLEVAVDFPARADLLRADAFQHRVRAGGDPVGATFRPGVCRCRGDRVTSEPPPDRHGARDRVDPERLAMQAVARVFASRRAYEFAQRAARRGQGPFVRDGSVRQLPGPLGAWTSARDLPAVPPQSFRDWWSSTHPDDRSSNA
jgi:hypothetical protein